ncbi:SDR family oxidoreductase [Peribacillus cavernae]|uniref:SDR family oxidoreductase n=1 Tax=Peribacillus cavernae TaxID=1674310 RepID=A0A433HNT7_9BACI|nr:SDR family oxidoreductase [Peribacillus cavernae]MDQ0217639.1 NADP-dependent 3-hydroxy acid dehydrogenase YdfG [Peribacillus cavernae]RUQ29933.1 SDR family oxidoreductase [Peribacillus cavernae]
MKSLEGKVAIVTGASSGIGEAIASDLAGKGANLVLVARREERLKELADKIGGSSSQKVVVVQGDVTKKEDLETAVQKAKEEFGKVDFLINNAGVMLLSFLKNDKIEEWEQMVDVNIKGVLFGIHAVLPEMLKQGSGHIVNVSSVAGHEVFPSSTVYSATKYAVRALSIGLEKELSKTGVRVTNISPGAVSTELTEHISDKEVLQMFESSGSTTGFLQANDIAHAVTYAVSQPDYVNVNEMIVRPMQKKE